MPIYEYKCKKCGESFEALVRGTQKPACPKCGSKNLSKLVSGFAVSVKSSAACKHPGGGGHSHGCCCGHCGCGH